MNDLTNTGEFLLALYESFASIFYLLVACAVAVWGLVYAIQPHRGNLLWEALRQPTVWITGLAVLLLQFLACLLAVLFWYWEQIEGQLVLIVCFNWLLVLLALPIAPMGLQLTRELRTIPPGNPRRYWFDITAATLIIIIFSYAWYFGIGIFIDLHVMEFFEALMSSGWALLAMTPLVIVAAVIEEVIFRLGLQGLLEKACRRLGIPVFLAVILASLVWAIGHAGMLRPAGIKEGQIFLIGLILGWLKIRHGAGACITGHLALNVSAVLAEILFDIQWT